MLIYNPKIKDVLKLLKAENLPYEERAQLSSLVNDFGYWGARNYLDPAVKLPWNPDRDSVMVLKHYNILLKYEKEYA